MTAATTLDLPRPDRTVERYTFTGRHVAPPPGSSPPASRVVYAATHVVADPLADADPSSATAIDWEATLAFRRHLWSLGFGVADAMDTAQRGMGLDWPAVQELIRRSVTEARACGGLVACGITTDQLAAGPHQLSTITNAYEEQLGYVEDLGGRAVIMASRALAAVARDADDYLAVYDRVLSQVSQPVILHWLGEMFDPALAGYWGYRDAKAAADVLLRLVTDHAGVIDGVKISLLDADLEVAFRRRLPAGVRCYTGDDFNFAELIAGDDEGHSHALLGIFDAIAPIARSALVSLDAGDRAGYDALLVPTVPLARHIFSMPTYHYKTGLVFLAYLGGHQDHFRMVGGHESARSAVHLAELLRLADRAGLFADAERAAARARHVFALAGVYA
jgi:Protein of unknown function (DUF993)